MPGITESIPWLIWIEGIGYLRGLLFKIGDMPTNGLWNDIICFKENSNWLYHNSYYSNCFYKTDAVDKITIDRDIVISPNPIHTNAHVEFNNTRYVKLVITNLFGNVLKVYQTKGETSIEINKGNLPEGLYILNLFEETGKVVSKKIIFE